MSESHEHEDDVPMYTEQQLRDALHALVDAALQVRMDTFLKAFPRDGDDAASILGCAIDELVRLRTEPR